MTFDVAADVVLVRAVLRAGDLLLVNREVKKVSHHLGGRKREWHS